MVAPIVGKAVLDKEKTMTRIKYVEVEPEETDPDVKVVRRRKSKRSKKEHSEWKERKEVRESEEEGER